MPMALITWALRASASAWASARAPERPDSASGVAVNASASETVGSASTEGPSVGGGFAALGAASGAVSGIAGAMVATC